MSSEGQARNLEGARTAAEAGWHESRYNLKVPVPNTEKVAIANLYAGTCAKYGPLELYLLSELDRMDENHPMVGRLARRGVIANFDELAALELRGRAACAMPHGVELSICPTLGCNFDCPYCFEEHRAGRMSQEVQDDVVALAGRMLDASGAPHLLIEWFGGEPLLAPGVIESLSARLIETAESRGREYSATIVTNGYLIDQDVVDMLSAAKVGLMQVTIDGLGATHDATRHLAGGGATFDRIVANLRITRIPFSVNIRHNVHDGNRPQIDDLRAFVEQLAEESGNDLSYYPAPVRDNAVADARGNQVGLFCGSGPAAVSALQEAGRFRAGRGHYCGAHGMWNAGIDEKGRLYKCVDAVAMPQTSFGTARDRDPADPFATSTVPDNLTAYLNTACPIPDEECRECVWLPLCAGGCPHERLFGEGRQCLAFKDDPEPFVLALVDRIDEKMKAAAEAENNANMSKDEMEGRDV